MLGLYTPQQGLTLVELLLALAMAALIMAGLAGVVGNSLEVEADTRLRADAQQQLHFAMQRMGFAVANANRLLLPLADNPNTNWPEHLREQTIPASPPIGSSTFASAVLAVTPGVSIDLDQDGWADANNDKDYLDLNNNGSRDAGEPERIDEDLDSDNTNDGANGIVGIDDNGNGTVDDGAPITTGAWRDNDEDDSNTDDDFNGIDDDGDGSIDEDIRADMNADFESGVAGVDDDLDGNIDEDHQLDDDEDGSNNEDWYDPIVYYLSGSELIERWPAQYDANGDSVLDGRDFTESVLAANVSHFRVERLPSGNLRYQLLDLTLAISRDGETFSVSRRLRLGGGR